MSEEAVVVLQKNSIEDYLLVPEAIKKAFPRLNLSTQGIENFLVKNRGKKNKKYLLQSLLKEGGLRTYDKDFAKRIAQKIEKDEIDAELVEKLKTIANAPQRPRQFQQD
jgi:ATP-dependent Lon protease